MDYRTFAAYNVLGALLWTLSFTAAGYFFGPPASLHYRIICL